MATFTWSSWLLDAVGPDPRQLPELVAPGAVLGGLKVAHGSALLYALLHLAQEVAPDGRVLDSAAVSLADLQNFRQLGSRRAGHPEYGLTTGVEATTGPLGTGLATSVGTAAAARWFTARYGRPGYDLFGYDTYALCGDGDLMEGVAAEAASLAGHMATGLADRGHTARLAWDQDFERFSDFARCACPP